VTERGGHDSQHRALSDFAWGIDAAPVLLALGLYAWGSYEACQSSHGDGPMGYQAQDDLSDLTTGIVMNTMLTVHKCITAHSQCNLSGKRAQSHPGTAHTNLPRPIALQGTKSLFGPAIKRFRKLAYSHAHWQAAHRSQNTSRSDRPARDFVVPQVHGCLMLAACTDTRTGANEHPLSTIFINKRCT